MLNEEGVRKNVCKDAAVLFFVRLNKSSMYIVQIFLHSIM